MNTIKGTSLTKGIVRITYADGSTIHQRGIDMVRLGKWQHEQLVAQKDIPLGLPKVNAADYLSSLGLKIVDAQKLKPILLTPSQAGELFLELFVERAETVALVSGTPRPVEVREGLRIELVDPQMHMKDILHEIWKGNLAGKSPYGINIIQIGQQYRSGLGTYILAQQLIKARIGFAPDNFDIKAFYAIFKTTLGKEWTRQNLHFLSPNLKLEKFFSMKLNLEKRIKSDGLNAFLASYGSLRGMIRLAAEEGDVNLAHLFSVLGTFERLREILSLPEDQDLNSWQWKYINQPARVLNDLLIKLETAAKEKGWNAVIEEYGSLRGMIRLAAEADQDNFAQLFSALGAPEKLKELLVIPDDINLAGWKWKNLGFPCQTVNNLLNKLEKLAKEKGWEAVIQEYGTIRGMLRLAVEAGDLNLGQLFSVLGSPELLRELLSLPDDFNLDGWKWKHIGLPCQTLNGLLTKFETLAKEKGWEAVIREYGSIRGMIRLAAEEGDLNLGILYSALGSVDNLRDLFSIPQTTNLDGWKWEYINLSARSLNNLLTILENVVKEKGWNAMLQEYGTVRGMVRLAAEIEDINFSQLFSALGTVDKLRALLSIPAEINLDGWNWKQIGLPARTLNNLLIKLDTLAKQKGWDAVIKEYGSIRGMVRLAAEEENLNLGQLFSALGTADMRRELLSIPEDMNLAGWKWGNISLPSQTLNNLLVRLESLAKQKGWDTVIREYGSIRGMVRLAAEHEDLNLGNLFSALGDPQILRELFSIPADIKLEDWKWKIISLPSRTLNNLTVKLETFAKENGWEATIKEYGSVKAMVRLAAEYDDLNLGDLFSALGDPQILRELLSIPENIKLDGWRWKSISLPSQTLNNLLIKLETFSREKGWDATVQEYGNIRGMIRLAAEAGDINLGTIFSIFGTTDQLRELLSIPQAINLDGWRWKSIDLPSQTLNKLLVKLEAFAKEKGWDAMIREYGTIRGMIRLATEKDEINLGALFSALGDHQILRELLSIPEAIKLDGWQWKLISLPPRTLNKLIIRLETFAKERGWKAMIQEYGSVKAMISLAAEEDDLNLGHLFSALGTEEKLRELLSIPPDINLGSWRWRQITLPGKTLKQLLSKIESFAKQKGWKAFIEQYGTIRGMLRLAVEMDNIHLGNLFSALGTPQALWEFFTLPPDINPNDWKWKKIAAPVQSLIKLLTGLEDRARESDWNTVIREYGNGRGAEILADGSDINARQVKEAIGTPEKLKEFFDIPPGVQLNAWNMWGG